MGYRMDLKDADRKSMRYGRQNVLWVRAGIPTQT